MQRVFSRPAALLVFQLLFQLFFPGVGSVFAQTEGALVGRIVSSEGAALSGISVRIEETAQTATTGADGRFTLPGLAPGRYTVTISGGEFVPQRHEIEITSGRSLALAARLERVTASVDVVASLKEYHLDQTSLASRTDARLIDLPQSVQVFPNQLIEDRAILEGNELFRNVSGLNQNVYSAMTFRGFTQREILFNGVRGNPFGSLEGDVNNAGFSTSQIRLTNIQRVEVLKGPASSLYGSTEVGGLINYVTKKPKEVPDGELQVRFGSFAQKLVSGELTGPITDRLLARGAFYFEDRDSFRFNAGSTNSHAVGNLLYRANDSNRFSLEYEFINQRLPANRLRGAPVDAAGNFLTDIEWTATEPTDFIKLIARVLQLRGEHNTARAWNIDYTFRYLEYENNDKYHEPRGLNAATADGRTMRREFRNFFRWNDDWSLNANLGKRAEAPGFGAHTLLFGFERIAQDHAFRQARAREREVAGGTVPALDIFSPVYGRTDERNYTLSAFSTSTAQTRRTGFYAQDQVVLNRFVQLLVTGRVDGYNDRGFAGAPLKYEDTALSGRAGVVVKPVEQAALYASYANSFIRAPIYSQAPQANGPFDPETGNQFEVGVKTELLDRRLFISGAFFNIRKNNILRPDPLLGPGGDNANALLSVGRARSRGFEFNVEGFLTRRWYTAFNYANVNTRILKDNTTALIGRPLANAPKHTAGWFTRYNFLENTGVGFGLESVSERVEPFAGIRADGYTIADLSFYQDLNSRARLQLQITNITNRRYAASSLFASRVGNFPGQPRAVMLTLAWTPFRK
ncbi:MAG: TonB-dependent receptor [Acidobacteria bacterium]|nr:TonB-dependent receptor [Acidobacteriota bacterium]MCW5968570.1 TonB-dependent receptor [Blastocatellales bacterium]